MSYVPIVPVTPPPPSPRTRELADKLASVLIEFEKAHPTVTRAEVRHAAQLALQATGGRGVSPAPVVAAALGVLVLGILVAVYSAGGVTFASGQWTIVATVGALIVLALVVWLRRGP